MGRREVVGERSQHGMMRWVHGAMAYMYIPLRRVGVNKEAAPPPPEAAPPRLIWVCHLASWSKVTQGARPTTTETHAKFARRVDRPCGSVYSVYARL